MSVRFRWRTHLRSATTQKEVVDLVGVYLESWSAEEVAALPEGVWPGAIASSRDLVRAALKVGQSHSVFHGTRAALALLQELLLFMTQASVRATQLAHFADDGESLQRPVGGKVLSEEEKKLFEAPPLERKPEKQGD